MKNNTFLSLLAFSLLVTLLPISASAAAPNTTNATVDGLSSTTVNIGSPVDIGATTFIQGQDWRGTRYLFSTSTATPTLASMACINTSDSSGNNLSFSIDPFSVSAPSAVGTYNLYVSANNEDDCSGSGQGNGNTFKLTNALTVQATPQTIDFTTITPLAKTYGDTPVPLSASAPGGAVTFTTSAASSTCTVTGDTVTFTGSGSCPVSANQAGNETYAPAPTVTQTFTIGAATLTIGDMASTTANKIYDGLLSVILSGQPDVTGKATSSDDIGMLVGTFDSKNVGNGKTVTLSFNGPDAFKYIFGTSTMLGNITTKSLTVTASGTNKTYDGTVEAGAAVTFTSNKIGTDTLLTITGTSTFADKHVGTAKEILISDITIGGADASNYVLSNGTSSTTADINPLAITVTAQADTKAYDGTTTSSTTPDVSPSIVAGDTFVATQVFADSAVGANKTLIPTISIMDDNNGNNYTVSTSSQNNGTIIGKTVTLTGITVLTKVYDATVSATSSGETPTITGLLDEDISEVLADMASSTYVFDNANASSSKSVIVSGVTLTGAQAGNYILGPVVGTGSITRRPITVMPMATSTRVYDGTKDAFFATPVISSGTLAGTDVPQFIQEYETRFAGTDKHTYVYASSTGGVADGNGGNNYLISYGTLDDGVITPATLDVTALIGTKVYDGTTNASTSITLQYTPLVVLDTFTISYDSATYDDKFVGTGKNIIISNISKSGECLYDFATTTLSSNGECINSYNFATTTIFATGTIAKRTLNLTPIVPDKVYDTTTDATVSYTDDRLAGDDLNISTSTIATFDDANVGASTTVSLSLPFELVTGPDAINYELFTLSSTVASITPAPLAVLFTADNKVYDATTTATILTRSLSGILAAEDVTVSDGSAVFSDKNVGAGKTVTAMDFILMGGDKDNYMVDSVGTTTADITPTTITPTILAQDKVFDSTNTATATCSVSPISGDTATCTVGAATFADSVVGTDKIVTAIGIALGGTDMSNYTLTSTNATDTANITEAPVVPPTPTPNPPSTSGGTVTFGPGSSSITVVRPLPASGTPISAIATSSATSSLSCPILYKTHMRYGRVNDKKEVVKLQSFLNKQLKTKLPLTGFFGTMTRDAVKRFQSIYLNMTKPTGFVLVNTLQQMNALECGNTEVK